MSWQYRVVSKRVGFRPKVKFFGSLKAAERRLTLLGPEPWKAYGKEADDLCYMHAHGGWNGENVCHDGTTEKACAETERAEMPDLEWVRLERREVGPWESS